MVAVVFRLPDGYAKSEVLNGVLPAAEGDKFIYVPTWSNVFSLLNRFAQSQPTALSLDIESCEFVQKFAGCERVQSSSYAMLREQQGDNWRYPKMLEQKLGCMEHFRGDGRTQNEILDPEGTLGIGLPEFLSPNWKLRELPEVAVIDLGRLTITDGYSR